MGACPVNGGRRPLLPDLFRGGVSRAAQGLLDLVPEALTPPAAVAVMTGMPGTVPRGNFPPGSAGAQLPEDAVDHPAVILIGPTSASRRKRKQGHDPLPFLGTEIPVRVRIARVRAFAVTPWIRRSDRLPPARARSRQQRGYGVLP